MSGHAASYPELCVVCVRVSVCLCVVSFCTRALVPLFLLLNITIRSSPTCSRKKMCYQNLFD
jgi:hypothetical protein